MRLREYIDKWSLILLLTVVFFLSLDLSAIYPSMNALQVAGVIFNIILTFGLLAIYWDMSNTQEQQRRIMDKQENLMAANHAPRIQIYQHEVLNMEKGEHTYFVVRNEGEGSAENLRAGCQIYLAEKPSSLPVITSIESLGLYCYPRPLIKLEEDESLVELSGSTWLGRDEVSAFHGWLTFYKRQHRGTEKDEIEQDEKDGKDANSAEGGELSFRQLVEEIPVEEADMVYFQFYIQYEYADGREDKKEAPIYAIPPEDVLESDTFSEAIDEGEWITNLPTGFWTVTESSGWPES